MIIYINRNKNHRNYWVYVLKLTNGKYYVGLSKNVDKRFDMHRNGKGAKWTKLYTPIRIIERVATPYYSYKLAGPLEDKKTIQLMKKYGKENVRGGIYCAVNQDVIDEMEEHKLSNSRQKNSSGNKENINYRIRDSLPKCYVSEISDYDVYAYGNHQPLPPTGNMIKTKLYDDESILMSVWVDHTNKAIWMSSINYSRYKKQLLSIFDDGKVIHPKTININDSSQTCAIENLPSCEIRDVTEYDIYVGKTQKNVVVNDDSLYVRLVDRFLSRDIPVWVNHDKKKIWISRNRFNKDRHKLLRYFDEHRIH